nr:nucleolin-like [Setaria viridis]
MLSADHVVSWAEFKVAFRGHHIPEGYHANTDEKKRDRFRRGLNTKLRERLNPIKVNSYNELDNDEAEEDEDYQVEEEEEDGKDDDWDSDEAEEDKDYQVEDEAEEDEDDYDKEEDKEEDNDKPRMKRRCLDQDGVQEMVGVVHEQPCSENQGSNSKDNVDKPGNFDEESYEASSDIEGPEDIIVD